MKPADQIVIIGLTSQKKPCAARFDGAQADAVKKAASLMGLRTGVPKTDEAALLVAKLPQGKLFAAGRGLVPLVKTSLYEQLLQKLELGPEPAPASAGPSPVPTAAAKPDPALWNGLTIGSVVVALDSPDDGWWRATVVAESKDTLKLRWLDAPKAPPVTRKRHAVALLLCHS